MSLSMIEEKAMIYVDPGWRYLIAACSKKCQLWKRYRNAIEMWDNYRSVKEEFFHLGEKGKLKKRIHYMKRIYTIRVLIDGFFLSLDPYMCIFGVSLEGCFWLMMRVCVGCYCYSTHVSILYIFIDRQCFSAETTPACANVVVCSRLRSMCFVTNLLTLPNGIPEMSSPRSLLSFPSLRAHP